MFTDRELTVIMLALHNRKTFLMDNPGVPGLFAKIIEINDLINKIKQEIA
jgi:hypothetical protein